MALPFAQLVASTIKNFKKGFVEQVIADSILLTVMGNPDVAPRIRKAADPKSGALPSGIKFEDSPGTQIFFPIMSSSNDTVASYSRFETLDTTPKDIFSAAQYEWRSIAGSMHLANEDLDKNSGDQVKLFDLIQGHMDSLRLSLSDNITDKLLGVTALGSDDPLGLFDLIKDDPTTNPASGSLGGIDAVANTFWRNQQIDQASVAFGTDQTGVGMKNLRKLLRQTGFGSAQTQLLLSGSSAFDSVENSMLNQVRYTNEATKSIVSAGFNAFALKGIPFVLEKKIETQRTTDGLTGDAIYAMNLDFLKIFAMRKRWFEPSEVKAPTNQDSVIQHVITRLQFATNGRRYQGVLHGIAAV